LSRLIDLLDPRLIFAELSAGTKEGVLNELSGLLSEGRAESAGLLDRARVLAVLLERERLGSTGIGGGVALPHGHLPGLRRRHLLSAASAEAMYDEMLKTMSEG
jgi:PTS system nitrogen regulatory IIA component